MITVHYVYDICQSSNNFIVLVYVLALLSLLHEKLCLCNVLNMFIDIQTSKELIQ